MSNELADSVLRSRILNEIEIERTRQATVVVSQEFDKNNSRNDWVAFISAYAGRASDKVFRNQKQGEEFRANMVKVAALAIAAIEAHDKGWC